MARAPGFQTDCTIRFDGRVVPARTGEPVASALLAAGIALVARSPKYHRPRGPFCLSGSCGSCLVRVDGSPNAPACGTPCRDGLEVESQNAFPDARRDLLGAIDLLTPRGLDHHGMATWSAVANRIAVAAARRLAGLGRLPDPEVAAAARAVAPGPEERFDALVVGAGPAGLGAAGALAEAGRRVLLADQQPSPGGRLRCALGAAGEPDRAFVAHALGAVRRAGGEVATGTAVLGLWRDGGSPLAVLQGDAPSKHLRLVRAERIAICTGGHARPLAIPGGDRPGVHGARGLAAALAEHGVLPGGRTAVVGEGAEADLVGAVLAAAGVAVDRVVSAEGGRILGRARVRALALPGRRIDCDSVAVALPPCPASELARALGAGVDPVTAAVRADARGATAVPGLLAAGEVTGPMDAARAAEAGRRAGEAARG